RELGGQRAHAISPDSRSAGGKLAGLGTLDDRDAHGAAPLGPRPVIVAHSLEAEKVGEHEPRVARALADPAVGDHAITVLQPGAVAVDGVELLLRLEGAV